MDFLLLQVNIPTIEPWMIQIFTYLVMVFVMVIVLKKLGVAMGIDWKTLFDFKDWKRQKLINSEKKTKLKADALANEVKTRIKLEENKEDIKRYQKALEDLDK